MEYDSTGIQYTFQSAGMIEIMAYFQNSRLDIAPEKVQHRDDSDDCEQSDRSHRAVIVVGER